MIAMLGMYDMPALQDANDRFWQAIRAHLGFGPEYLSRDRDFLEMWRSPDLVLAQTCGMPYRTRLHGSVSLIGTPDYYGLPDCPPGYYQSVFVVHKDAPGDSLAEFSGGILAYNDAMSQSGWAAPMTHLQAGGVRIERFFHSGSHGASAQAVAHRYADIAGLDALTWALLQKHSDVAADLRVLGKTTPTPGLPYITASTRGVDALADAVRSAITGLSDADRGLLHLRGLVSIPAQAYLAVPTPARPDGMAENQ